MLTANPEHPALIIVQYLRLPKAIFAMLPGLQQAQ